MMTVWCFPQRSWRLSFKSPRWIWVNPPVVHVFLEWPCATLCGQPTCAVPRKPLCDGSWYEWFTKTPQEHITTGITSKLWRLSIMSHTNQQNTGLWLNYLWLVHITRHTSTVEEGTMFSPHHIKYNIFLYTLYRNFITNIMPDYRSIVFYFHIKW